MAPTVKLYPYSLRAVHDALVQALENNAITIKEDSLSHIRARSKASVWSWGEEINITLGKSDKGTNVTIESDAHSQLFDWGKNKDNIDGLLVSLEALLREK